MELHVEFQNCIDLHIISLCCPHIKQPKNDYGMGGGGVIKGLTTLYKNIYQRHIFSST